MSDKPSTALIGTYASVAEADADLASVVKAHGDSRLGHLEVAVLVDNGSGPKVHRHEKVGGHHVFHGMSDDMTRLGWSLPGDAVTLAVLCEDSDLAALKPALGNARETRAEAVVRPSMEDGFFEGSSSLDPLPGVGTGFEDGSVGHLGV